MNEENDRIEIKIETVNQPDYSVKAWAAHSVVNKDAEIN